MCGANKMCGESEEICGGWNCNCGPFDDPEYYEEFDPNDPQLELQAAIEELEEEIEEVEQKKVVVTMVPGSKVPVVYSFDDDVFSMLYDNIVGDEGFVEEDLTPALKEMYAAAEYAVSEFGNPEDVKNFVYAMAYRYPFYVTTVY